MNISITFNANTVQEFVEALQAAAAYAPQAGNAPRAVVNPPEYAEAEAEGPESPLVKLWKSKNNGAKFTPAKVEKARYGHYAPGPVPSNIREAVAKERLMIMASAPVKPGCAPLVTMEEIMEVETSAAGSAENLPAVPQAVPVDLSGMDDEEL